MRFRVDLKYGYVSFDEKDIEKAWELYREFGVRMRKCVDISDEGQVIAGLPIVEDLTGASSGSWKN